jgi:hypothetical protein
VHNIEEMICNIERHDDDDQYSNDKLVKYKKMIEDSKKSFYHSSSLEHIRERLAAFIVLEVISPKGEFYFTP